MASDNIQLEERLVGQIEGEFYVPSYQRGYRWDETQVTALLNDVYKNGENPYCLQPIVVRKGDNGRYELIDGQQRLTTLYIINKYIAKTWEKEAVNYSLIYETRKDNEGFFNHIDDKEEAKKNIDFFFMHRAYMTIKNWFESKDAPKDVANQLNRYFSNSVKVIWYELQSGTREDATELFTRLNIGRIPLTNAELVKALFLCKSDKITKDKQMEIALQWDTIEREMHDEDFWYFLTKKKAQTYDTKIELLFEFLTSKRENKKDRLSVFFYFSGNPMAWDEVLSYYYRLKEWYKKNNYYHKIGYLIASGSRDMGEIVSETKEMHKKQQEKWLDEEIKKSVTSDKPYIELSYEKSNEYDLITKILLLFNVVSLMNNKSGNRFPFKEFNTSKWSLEHIHAQHSESLNSKEQWVNWLQENLHSVKAYNENHKAGGDLVEKIEDALKNEDKLSKVTYTELANSVDALFQATGSFMHNLSNMALLQGDANAALNNSTFNVKRRKIIDLEVQGLYIPYCTRMVFMKYYTPGNEISYFSWNEGDRKAYIAKINEVLKDYLKDPVEYDSEQGN